MSVGVIQNLNQEQIHNARAPRYDVVEDAIDISQRFTQEQPKNVRSLAKEVGVGQMYDATV
ncbi:MAG: hypothetical protein A3G34_05720 [Candidatus Lindowbacteria bacterium RIFCSPLOWO2_12_FULL_62_27]|nr:MAG: hypothetical protein A3I06_13385 [Candidatus Lindowbacteria bacterium RIFCSPLOWO2_02_FULL_62_12]OGH59919.1 MAG: hypothetical protein A3G34_05720 [Candidatus Lindowbacteria bacterium RIFCSPLOWO2_12_FULL_62_27]